MIQDLLNIYRGDKITLLPLRLTESEKGFQPLQHIFSFNILDVVKNSYSTNFQTQSFLKKDLTKQAFIRNEPVVITLNGAFVTTPESTANEQFKDVLWRMREGRPMKFVNRYLQNTTVVIKNLETSMSNSEHYLAFQATFVHTFRNKISQTRPRVQQVIFTQPEKATTVKQAAKREGGTAKKTEDENRACDIIQKRDWVMTQGEEEGSYEITATVLPTDTINQIAAAANTTPPVILKLNPFLAAVDYNTKLIESSLAVGLKEDDKLTLVVGVTTNEGVHYGYRTEDDDGNLSQLYNKDKYSSLGI